MISGECWETENCTEYYFKYIFDIISNVHTENSVSTT